MNKNFLLITGNYAPEPTGIGKYNGEMIKWLAKQGHNCTVITTYPYYPQWEVQAPYDKNCWWFKRENQQVDDNTTVSVIRCPHYIPKNPSGINRILSELSFSLSAFLVLIFLMFKKKFHYILTVAPAFQLGLLGVLYKRIRGGKFLYHIQDLQIDAAKDLGMIKSNEILNAFFKVERYILKQADFVSTISQGMIEKVKNKCNKAISYFPNWVDINSFYPLNDRSAIKKQYGFKPTDKVVIYSGAIGHKQGLEAILFSADILRDRSDIKFAICGSGPYKENLVQMAQKMNLTNVIFMPLQPQNKLNSFLNIADLHLVLQKADGADLFFPSKLSTILAVGGTAIVTARSGSSLHATMQSTDMGILIEPENHDALVSAIVDNIESLELAGKGKNARNYAKRYLDLNEILHSYFTTIISEPVVEPVFTIKRTTYAEA